MRRFRIHDWCCSAGLTGLLATSAIAQSPLPSQASSTIGLGNSILATKTTARQSSPIEYFRELLSLGPEERKRTLAAYPPEQRTNLLNKLKEYDVLPPEFRELRLHHTQVRWHLLDLMKMQPNERPPRMERVPAADRPLIAERLSLWDKWPADVQKQFMENEGAMALLLQGQTGASDVRSTNMPPMPPGGNVENLARWQSLPENQRELLCERFREFFDLDQGKKKKTLKALPQAQRLQVEKTLQAIEGLPVEQRKQRMEALRKFATMPPEVQKRFLRNAARWNAMSAQDRALWRDMATKLPPMPPLPPGLATNLPPMPPGWSPMPPMPQTVRE